MKVDIITIFPELFENFTNTSIIKKAIDNKSLNLNLVNLRDFSKNKQKQVDDTPYGGGAGMILMFPPLYDAVNSLKRKNSKTIILTPQGKTYNQEIAKKLAKEKHLIIICGRYEGFDERVFSLVDEQISIGDYILMGGEIPAMVILESLTRIIPGVIENESVQTDSFENNLLKYPQYTKPREYQGLVVPDVLLSGDHLKIKTWREQESFKNTLEKRPDLIKKNK